MPKESKMRSLLRNEHGYAMVITLAFIMGLSLLAVIVVNVATSEKQTAFNETTHTQAFYAADAGGEAAVNWLRFQTSPPARVASGDNHVFVPTGYTPLGSKNDYRYDVEYMGKTFRPGWSTEYRDYIYDIDADGASSQASQATVAVQALRLYREGY
jgi:hypothetical protein